MDATKLKFNGLEWQFYPRTEADISVMREIFKLREYRLADNVIRSATEPILDVGAHVGFFSIYCRSFNSKVKIFAIEPEKNNFDLLKKHLQVNAIKNIKIFNTALAGRSQSYFLVKGSDTHNHYIFDQAKADSTKIDCISLRDFCHQNKINKISLLKMDIEGAEYDIFDNLAEADYGLLRNIIMEYHNYYGRDYHEIENKLREHGFGVQIFPSKFDKRMGFLFAGSKRR